MQAGGGRQLKTRKLRYKPRALLPAQDLTRYQRPHVAHRFGGVTARAQQRGREQRRGRLAVGSRNRDPAIRALAPGELRLAHHLARMRLRGTEEG